MKFKIACFWFFELIVGIEDTFCKLSFIFIKVHFVISSFKILFLNIIFNCWDKEPSYNLPEIDIISVNISLGCKGIFLLIFKVETIIFVLEE